MRWQQLFADLQAQFEAEEAAADRAESASRARAEVGACGWPIGCAVPSGVPLSLAAAAPVRWPASCVEVGADWLLLEDDGARVLVALGRSAGGRRASAGGPRRRRRPGLCAGRLDLRRALRGLARDRSRRPGRARRRRRPRRHAWTGWARTTSSWPSTRPTCPRRAEAVQGVRAVVIAAVAIVRTVTPGI